MSAPEQTPAGAIGSSELRRDVSVWGSYMWGYADVGADIYVALGIVALAAGGDSLIVDDFGKGQPAGDEGEG